MEKKRILHPEKRYEKAFPEEMSTRILLSGKRKLLTNDERNVILNLDELFNQERQDSKIYKIYGKIRMIFRNMYTGSTNYEYLSNRLYLNGDGSDGSFDGYLPYDEFAFIRRDTYHEIPIVPKLGNLSEFDGFDITHSGSTQHSTITNLSAPKHNWNFYLSYVYSQDNLFPMTYTLSGDTPSLSFMSGEGIPFRVLENGNAYKLTSPVQHGMNQGEYIIINGYPYHINFLGDETYNSEKYVINIYKNQIPSGDTSFTNLLITGKRCLDKDNMSKTTSQYYVHKHKTLTDVDGYLIDKAGFESSIWREEKKLLFETKSGDNNVLVERNRMENLIYDMKEPFVLSGLTNNLGYTPTDVYVSVILRNGNGFFEYPPKVGFSFNFHNNWIDEHFDGDSSKETTLTGTDFTRTSGVPPVLYSFTSGNTIPTGTTLTGAFIEYIPTEMKERVISESQYKFYTKLDIFDYGQTGDTINFSGATTTNLFGLFYQPHYRVKLRELSPYVETSSVLNIENLPQNAKYDEVEKLWKWRDLYNHGYVDDSGNGTDYPFINNIHYVKRDINFALKNERFFTNKADGLFSFDNKNNQQDIINCK